MGTRRFVQGAVTAAIAAFACLAIAAPAQAIKMKYERVVNVVNGDSIASVDAMCPDGYNVTGGGGFSNGAYLETMLQDSYPIDGGDANSKPDDGWRATIWNTASTPRNTEVQAACAKARTKYKTAQIDGGTGGKRAKCPDGSSVSGGGVNVFELFGFPYRILESIPVRYDPNSARARAWFVFTGDGGQGLAKGGTVYAACIVDKAANMQARREFFDVAATSQGDGEVLCKRKEKMTGVGAVVGTQQGWTTTIFGADGSDNDLRLDDGSMVTIDNEGAEPIPSEAYALCAE